VDDHFFYPVIPDELLPVPVGLPDQPGCGHDHCRHTSHPLSAQFLFKTVSGFLCGILANQPFAR
jgi:hypothetical protein